MKIVSLLIVICILFFAGCTRYSAKLPDNTEIDLSKMFTMSSAKKIEFYYQDPNGVVLWVILNDPNSKVNPGGIEIVEPKTGIKLIGMAK